VVADFALVAAVVTEAKLSGLCNGYAGALLDTKDGVGGAEHGGGIHIADVFAHWGVVEATVAEALTEVVAPTASLGRATTQVAVFQCAAPHVVGLAERRTIFSTDRARGLGGAGKEAGGGSGKEKKFESVHLKISVVVCGRCLPYRASLEPIHHSKITGT
jgi:hypothetical protein